MFIYRDVVFCSIQTKRNADLSLQVRAWVLALAVALGKPCSFVRSISYSHLALVQVIADAGGGTWIRAGTDVKVLSRDEFGAYDNDSDVSDSDFSEGESDDEDLPPPPPPPLRAPAARGRGRGGQRGQGGQRGRGGRIGLGGRGGAPNVQVNARIQAGLQRAAPVGYQGNDPIPPLQEFLAAAL